MLTFFRIAHFIACVSHTRGGVDDVDTLASTNPSLSFASRPFASDAGPCEYFATLSVSTAMASDNPLLQALAAKQVSASVVDLDHYPIHGGMAVETDYIIAVEPKNNDDTIATFESYRCVQWIPQFLSYHITDDSNCTS